MDPNCYHHQSSNSFIICFSIMYSRTDLLNQQLASHILLTDTFEIRKCLLAISVAKLRRMPN